MSLRTIALCTAVSLWPSRSQGERRYEFDVELGGWHVFELRMDGRPAQPTATLDITDEPANVKTGIGPLQFAYRAEKGVIRAIVLGEPQLAGMRSLHGVPAPVALWAGYGSMAVLSGSAELGRDHTPPPSRQRPAPRHSPGHPTPAGGFSTAALSLVLDGSAHDPRAPRACAAA